ncbi:ABC transporter permease [Streptococcus halotolerans]|uniref:ABC transporter permease n=1 Tax=Streptococcus halotolerans TaxID=1814128 RepID=UPI0007880441|nr:ABC transporter permease [Streptococcus halotolerans]
MHKVDSRNWLFTLCRKNMKANKLRNLILTIAISLTAFMMTSVFTVAGSMIKGMEKSAMYQVGTDSHAGFKYLTKEQFNKLSKDDQINRLSYNVIVGQPINEELREDYTEIRYTETDNAKHSFALPTIGKLPKKYNEIATSTNVIDNFGIPRKVGQKIHLTIYNGINTYEGDFIISGMWEKPTATLTNQIFVSKKFQEDFSPIWQNESEKSQFMGENSYAGSINPIFNFRNSININKQVNDLKSRLGFGKEVNEGVNWAYSASSIDSTSIAIVGFLLGVIFISGYLIISNIFNISVTADIQYFGLLKTIGTTNKQLKKLVIGQAIMMSIFAIPIGLLFGYLASLVIIPFIINNMVSIPFNMEFNIWFFVISAVFSWLTVRVSCLRPCKIVSRISPIEAIRYTSTANTNNRTFRKKYKVSPVMMAWQNLGRHKMKSLFVVFSMALSIIMLNITGTLVASFDENLYVKSFANSDFTIADASLFNKQSNELNYEGVSQTDIDYFKKLTGIEEIGAIAMSLSVHKVEGMPLKRVRSFYKMIKDDIDPEDSKDLKNEISKNHNIYSSIFGLDQMIYKNLEMKSGVVDWEKFNSGNYVVISTPMKGSKDDSKYSFYKVGDSISVKLPDGSNKTYEVMGIGCLPYAMGPGFSRSMDMNIMLPLSEYTSYSTSNKVMKVFIDVDKAHIKNIEKRLLDYCEKEKPLLDLESRSAYKEGFKHMKQMFIFIGGSLSFIVALIGILNFINLTYMTINERRDELNTLHAIGMTYKQIKTMLYAEGIIRIVLTYVTVLLFGIGLTYKIVNMIAGQMIMFKYQFVTWPILVTLPLSISIVFIIPNIFKWKRI